MSGRLDGPMPLAAYANGRCINGLASSGRLRTGLTYPVGSFDGGPAPTPPIWLDGRVRPPLRPTGRQARLDTVDERCATPRVRALAEGNKNPFCPGAPRGGIEVARGTFNDRAEIFSRISALVTQPCC
jgi:hypothetical protein